MSIKYRLKSENVRELVFTNPQNLNNTLTVRCENAPKKAGSQSVQNVRSSIKAVRTVDVASDCVDPCKKDQENLSVTLSVSGSVKSKSAVKTAVQDVIAAWHRAFDDDLSIGFLPSPATYVAEEDTVVTISVP